MVPVAQVIKRNAIRCTRCGDVIESMHRHDFRRCSCGAVAVDGGHDYLKRCFKVSPDDFEELSEWVDMGPADDGPQRDARDGGATHGER